MLDAFVIEEIKRRDQRRDERPALELPVPPPPPPTRSESEPEKPHDGVVIIDYTN